MKIIKAITPIGEDYTALYRCEFCGKETKWSAENTERFTRLEVPKKRCPRCHKRTGGHLSYPTKIKTWHYHGKVGEQYYDR